MVNLERKDEITPICPHCKQELDTVNFTVLSGILGKRYIYCCPGCRACLGISHRKGFLMG
jgi:hypothetical protein